MYFPEIIPFSYNKIVCCQELDERSFPELTRNGTYDKDSAESHSPPPSHTGTEPRSTTASQLKPSPQQRTPARPRRSNISYVSQPIEAIAQIGGPALPETDPGSGPSSGLMFIRVSPSHQEKRKPSEERPVAGASQWKRSRVAEARNAAGASGRSGAVSRPAAVRLPPSRTSCKSGASAAANSRRSLQPAKRLSLAKPAVKSAPVVHHPNPFAARNMYYDERWVEKQERGFSHWLNFVLTPQGLEDSVGSPAAAAAPGIGGLDVARLWGQCSQDVRIPRAPTREVMSMRAYTARREMNRLRRNACRIWQSREVAAVINKLEIEIEKLRLVIRKVFSHLESNQAGED